MQTGRRLLRGYVLGSLMLGPLLLTAGVVREGTSAMSLTAAVSLGAALVTLFWKLEQQNQLLSRQRELLESLAQATSPLDRGLSQ